MPDASRYARIIEHIFRKRFKRGAKEVPFKREEIVRIAKQLRMDIPKNLGNLIYSFRYRTPLPASVRAKAPKGKEWIIRPRGRAQYCFEAVSTATVVPNKMMSATKVPDATPGVIAMCAAKFPALMCRPITAQFMADDAIALLAFEAADEGVRASAEKHHRLVPPGEMTAADLRAYREALQ